MITLNVNALTAEQLERVSSALKADGFTVATTDDPIDVMTLRAPWKYSPHDWDPSEADAFAKAMIAAGVPSQGRPHGNGEY